MKLEYLAIIPSESSFCENIPALKNLLQSDANIKIVGKKIKHEKFEADYEIQDGKNVEKKHRFYHIRLLSDSPQVEEFSKMGRAIRKILNIASHENVQTLWDDISFHYAQNSYPAIHEIENLMRKLITKFMLTNVGIGWAKETVPYEIKKNTRTDVSEASSNYLYEVDFIQLSEFLFNDYSTSDISSFIKKLTDTKDEVIKLEEISDFIPKSNWKRYFEPHVDCDASYLQSRWKKLYELRCKIAHNNTFIKADYEQTLKIAGEVKEKLNKAVKSLDEISVPEKDREELAESVISHTNSAASLFLAKLKEMDKELQGIYRTIDKQTHQSGIRFFSPASMFRDLLKAEIMSEPEVEILKKYRAFRSTLLHGSFMFPEEYLLEKLKELTPYVDYLSAIRVARSQANSGERGNDEQGEVNA